MYPQKLLSLSAWFCTILAVCLAVLVMPVALTAQETSALSTTAAPPIVPPTGAPIISNEKPLATHTPKPEPRFEIGHFSTSPEQPRISEGFELHLEIMNVGAGPAIDFIVENKNCGTSATVSDKIISEGLCSIPLPRIEPGQSAQIALNLRATSTKPEEEQSIGLTLSIAPLQVITTTVTELSLNIFFRPARAIPDEKPTLIRPFPEPEILIQSTWTAKARSTVEELLTRVPLIINSIPMSPGLKGGPEFELVVELRNDSNVEATNIFIDFCADPNSNFNPAGSSCQKYVPTTLAQGGHAIASQTLAYKNSETAPVRRGEAVKLDITYDFWYVEGWIQRTISYTVYLYPEFYPAATAVPALQTPYLDINTPQLNVRQGPGTNYPLVGVGLQHNRFTITGQHKEWWQIDFRGVTAWVSAAYVIAWGGERVPAAASIPPPPPAAPPPPPNPIPTPNPNPVGLSQESPVLAAASIDPSLSGESLLVTEPTRTGDFIFVNESGDDSARAGASSNTLNPESSVILERYSTTPARITDNGPFVLELALRNTGQTTARQVVLGWRSEQIVPFGAGTTRWLDDLAPGGVIIVTGQFLLVDQPLETFIQLPVEVLYTDDSGQLSGRVEQLNLLQQGPDGILPLAAPVPAQDERSLWLRLALGLIGLGAEP